MRRDFMWLFAIAGTLTALQTGCPGAPAPDDDTTAPDDDTTAPDDDTTAPDDDTTAPDDDTTGDDDDTTVPGDALRLLPGTYDGGVTVTDPRASPPPRSGSAVCQERTGR